MDISTIISVAAVLGGLVFVFVRFAKFLGSECIFCGGRSLKMDQLPKAEYSKLRDYFWNVEKRVPIADSIYVCCECYKVNDDCISRYTSVGMTIICKACGHSTNLDDRMTCGHCKAVLEWVTFKECGDYRFLLPRKNRLEENNRPNSTEGC